jgi:RNA 2',3'-cyclic 3'-phosphodiesterase
MAAIVDRARGAQQRSAEKGEGGSAWIARRLWYDRAGEIMRAFFCAPVPDALRESVHATAERLRSRTAMRASWVPSENYHATLRFLGDIEPGLTVDLDRIARSVCGRFGPFRCVLDRVGAFPGVHRARVIWMGGEAPPPFAQLLQALSLELVGLGFPQEKSEHLVHVTLARVKDRPDPALPGVFAELNPVMPVEMVVDRIVLMESHLTPRGAVYTPLFTTWLGVGR